ncbi:MAG: hypothetical protein QM831_39635 [Kofleriaceae bacterium]
MDEAVRARFARFVRARGVFANSSELDAALDRARDRYLADDALLVCDAHPCNATNRLTLAVGMPVRRTGCQGFCKHKPMMTLRVGSQRELIGRATPSDHDAIEMFARAALQERSLLVPQRSAIEPLRIDAEHGDTPAGQLRAVHFLCRRFRGAGRYTDGSYSFTKEVVGSYEAGGRFLSLRMEAHYPTSDRGVDVHRALVIVGVTNAGTLTGRAFTDGGDVHDYEITYANDELEFADRSPDHGMRCTAVRKRLRPTPDGYEECLEVDRGRGFQPYYAIAMRAA